MYINNKYKSGQGLALRTEKTNFSANAFLLGKILSQPVCDRRCAVYGLRDQKSVMPGDLPRLEPATSSAVVQQARFHASAGYSGKVYDSF
jgi:hypothetical protein